MSAAIDLARVGALVAEAAAEEILPRYRNLAAGETGNKTSAEDLVTVADQGMETRLAELLQAAWPEAEIIGEEAVFDAPHLLDRIAEAPLAFILDPIDGTWNFANGLPVFGVIVAVTQHGQTTHGLIADPLAGDYVAAERGAGAWRQGPNGAERLGVAAAAPLDAMSGYVPLGLFDRERRAAIAPLLPDFVRVLSLRASAFEYRMIAQGAMHFSMSEGLKPWDHAAGQLLHQEAGGHSALFDGRAYAPSVHTGNLLLAPDPDSWQALRAHFAPAFGPQPE